MTKHSSKLKRFRFMHKGHHPFVCSGKLDLGADKQRQGN